MQKHLQTIASLLLVMAVSGCAERTAEKPPLTASQLRGQKLYETSCAVCHRADSTEPLNGPGLKGMYGRKYLTSGLPANDERVEEIIRRGRRTMPAYSHLYDDKQMADLIAYLHSL